MIGCPHLWKIVDVLGNIEPRCGICGIHIDAVLPPDPDPLIPCVDANEPGGGEHYPGCGCPPAKVDWVQSS